MKVTPNIIRREFIGTEAKIVESKHRGIIGTTGRIIDETRNTFMIKHEDKKMRVIKNLTVFHFGLPDGTVVEIDGELLVGKPEDRLKRRVRRNW